MCANFKSDMQVFTLISGYDLDFMTLSDQKVWYVCLCVCFFLIV